MHDIVNSILLGIVEGLTEFLPVSSTGHLLVTEHLLGLPDDKWEAFTIIIQLGAILSVVAVYWRKFWDVLVGLPTSAEARQFAINVIVAFFPAAIIGAALIKYINGYLLQPSFALPVIATSWIVGGVIILIFERIAPKPKYLDGDHLPFAKALQIGFCQCLAILPGVSRSGATILGGELLGVERKAAAAFTFYLAVPTMFGATVFEMYKKWDLMSAAAGTDIAIGFVVSFIVAYGVVKTFIGFIGRYGLKPFGWYRLASGVLLTAYLLMH
ncbi:MAG: undecaprenyl-diphosphate phosphatase [Alphaproteobacteria bacterium]|nr:undecaprenyl-diphosphate phosphatase [Alphaproteobacteria bacterium]MDE1987460.1 undecaprenyl-diphosphate phosphatase [Alphaproteobacteria bacterium]MDE2164670.1 undecaprenyl-diphosphate phosphatase [Alphaproteobacteria bacterium]